MVLCTHQEVHRTIHGAVGLKINYLKWYTAGFIECNVLQLCLTSQLNSKLHLGQTCAVDSVLHIKWPNGNWLEYHYGRHWLCPLVNHMSIAQLACIEHLVHAQIS